MVGFRALLKVENLDLLFVQSSRWIVCYCLQGLVFSSWVKHHVVTSGKPPASGLQVGIQAASVSEVRELHYCTAWSRSTKSYHLFR